MKDLEVFDFHRIFIGDAPYLFLLEIVFRTFIMYAYAILMLRFLGKRGMGQLSSLELAIIISFGSAIGDPMMGADVPIIHGIVAVTTVSLIQVYFEKFINRYQKLEHLMEGVVECLVDDGIINVEVLTTNNLSHEDLFRSLRIQEVEQLGQIKKAYFETSGQISVIFHSPRKIKPGLSVMPDDLDVEKEPLLANNKGLYCCKNCGNSKSFEEQQNFEKCRICCCERWEKAEV